MLGVAPRYDAERFGEYFADDFSEKPGTRLWEEKGAQVIDDAVTTASIVPVGAEVGVLGAWKKLVPGVLQDRVNGLVDALSRWKRRRVCALEMTFSPPKSISIAALAGPEVVVRLCQIHAEAVDFVLGMLPQFLFSRCRKPPRRRPIEVDLLRFRHPFSFAEDPQLHDHVDVVWSLDGPALHGYPLFFHQFALRQCYHYALVSGLKREGFGVRIHHGRTLIWELEGIDDEVLAMFSKRRNDIELAADRLTNYYSRGAALRYTALSSRAILPQTEAGFTLGKARESWQSGDVAGRCLARMVAREEASELQFGDLQQFFRCSAVTTQPILEGRILAACLGQPVPGALALRQIRDRIAEAIEREEIVGGDGGTLCDPATYRHEREITRLVFAGIGEGAAQELVAGKPLRVERAAAARPDQIRIVAGGGELTGPVEPDALRCEPIDEWDAALVHEMLEDEELDEILISVAERPHIGDFLHFISRVGTAPSESSLSKSRRMKVGGRPVRIREGKIPRDAGLNFGILDRLGDGALVVVPGDYPEPARRERNMRRGLAELEKIPNEMRSQLLELEEAVPWEWVGDDFQWRLQRLYVFKTNPLFQIGSRWTALGIGRGGLLVGGIVKSRRISTGDLEAHRDEIALVRPYAFRLHDGAVLETMLPCMRRGKKKISLQEGEIVVVRSVGDDGSIRLADGRLVPPDFRAFYPATLVREFAPAPGMEPRAAICEDDGSAGALGRLAPLARARQIVVLTDSEEDFRAQFAKEKRAELQARRDRSISCRQLGDKPYLVFPPLKSWEAKVEEILESKEKALDAEHQDLDQPAAVGVELQTEASVAARPVVQSSVPETGHIGQVAGPPHASSIEEPVGKSSQEFTEQSPAETTTSMETSAGNISEDHEDGGESHSERIELPDDGPEPIVESLSPAAAVLDESLEGKPGIPEPFTDATTKASEPVAPVKTAECAPKTVSAVPMPAPGRRGPATSQPQDRQDDKGTVKRGKQEVSSNQPKVKKKGWQPKKYPKEQGPTMNA